MVYRCDRCQAALMPGARVCAACGRLFDAPVPGDAETPEANVGAPNLGTPNVGATLEGRTAAGGWGRPASAASLPPQRTAGPSPRRGLWIGLGAMLVVLLLLGGLAGGAYTLWRHGPGGTMSFYQANIAGNDAYGRGDFVTADIDYGQMIALRPDRPDGYMLRGIAEFAQRQFTRSIADDTAGLADTTDPDERADFLDNRGQAQFQRGDLPDAIRDYSSAEAAYKQVTNPQELSESRQEREANLRLRAQAYLAHKDNVLAIADCTTLIARGHVQPDDFFTRGDAEAALGRSPAAWADMGRAISHDPAYQPGLNALGKLADQTRQYPQAVAVLQQAAQVSPDNVSLLGSLGWFQYKARQIPAAIATDKRAQALDSTQGWIAFNLALCYAVQGNQKLSTAAYAAALTVGSAADRTGGLSDIHDALARQPNSAVLKLAQAQVEQGRAALPAATAPAAPQVASQFAGQIAPQATFSDFSICPPRGYTLQQTSAQYFNGNQSTFLWTGPAHADGTVPTLQVSMFADDGTAEENTTSSQVLQTDLAHMATNHTRLTTTPISPCAIGGRQFQRGGWSGVGVRTGKPYQGVFYVFVESGHLVEIQTHDEAASAPATLPLLNASVMTFRKL